MARSCPCNVVLICGIYVCRTNRECSTRDPSHVLHGKLEILYRGNPHGIDHLCLEAPLGTATSSQLRRSSPLNQLDVYLSDRDNERSIPGQIIWCRHRK